MSKKSKTFNIKQYRWVIWIALVVVVGVLVLAYADALDTRVKLQNRIAAFEPKLTVAKATQEALEARLIYVQKDTYVEQWAREEAKMTQPGETLVVIVEPATATPEPQASPAPQPETTAEPDDVTMLTRLWRALTGQD